MGKGKPRKGTGVRITKDAEDNLADAVLSEMERDAPAPVPDRRPENDTLAYYPLGLYPPGHVYDSTAESTRTGGLSVADPDNPAFRYSGTLAVLLDGEPPEKQRRIIKRYFAAKRRREGKPFRTAPGTSGVQKKPKEIISEHMDCYGRRFRYANGRQLRNDCERMGREVRMGPPGSQR